MHICIQPNSRFDSLDARCTPPGDTEKVRSVGWFHERLAPSSAENCVASPSIMKRPLIMKVAEGVPSGGITIFHAYCLTTKHLQAPFCLPRYQPPLPSTLLARIDPFFALTYPRPIAVAISGAQKFASS